MRRWGRELIGGIRHVRAKPRPLLTTEWRGAARAQFLKSCESDNQCKADLLRSISENRATDANGHYKISDEKLIEQASKKDILTILGEVESQVAQDRKYCGRLNDGILTDYADHRSPTATAYDGDLETYKQLAAKDPYCLGVLKIHPPVWHGSSKPIGSGSLESLGIDINCYDPDRVAEILCYATFSVITGALTGAATLKLLRVAGIAEKSTAGIVAGKGAPAGLARRIAGGAATVAPDAESLPSSEIAKKVFSRLGEIQKVSPIDENYLWFGKPSKRIAVRDATGRELGGIVYYRTEGGGLYIRDMDFVKKGAYLSEYALDALLKLEKNVKYVEASLEADNRKAVHEALWANGLPTMAEPAQISAAIENSPLFKALRRLGCWKLEAYRDPDKYLHLKMGCK